MISSVANRLKWFIMYFILLSVRSIVLMMSATSFDIYKVKMSTWKLKSNVIYVAYFLMAASILTVNILESYCREKANLLQLFKLIELVVKLIIFSIDIYMVKIFI